MAKKKKVAKKKSKKKKRKIPIPKVLTKNTRMGNVKTGRSLSRNSPRSESNNLGKAI